MSVYQDAINTWGTESQIDVAIGEFAELIDALIKNRRHQECDVVCEIADAHVMLEQLKIIFDKDECAIAVTCKERALINKIRDSDKHKFR